MIVSLKVYALIIFKCYRKIGFWKEDGILEIVELRKENSEKVFISINH